MIKIRILAFFIITHHFRINLKYTNINTIFFHITKIFSRPSISNIAARVRLVEHCIRKITSVRVVHITRRFYQLPSLLFLSISTVYDIEYAHCRKSFKMARSNILLSIYDSSTNTEICFIAGVYYDIFCSIAGDNNDNPIPQVKFATHKQPKYPSPLFNSLYLCIKIHDKS